MTSSNGNISTSLSLRKGISPVTGEFPLQMQVTRSFDIYLICAWTNCWVNNPDAVIWDAVVLIMTSLSRKLPHHKMKRNHWLYSWDVTMLKYASTSTVYPKKYAHGFVVLCFVVVMQSFIMNSHEVFIHIHQGCFAGTGAIVKLPQCQWSKPDGFGK